MIFLLKNQDTPESWIKIVGFREKIGKLMESGETPCCLKAQGKSLDYKF